MKLSIASVRQLPSWPQSSLRPLVQQRPLLVSRVGRKTVKRQDLSEFRSYSRKVAYIT
jgi:hypothetical protein